MAFRPHLAMGLAFYGKGVELPTDIKCPLGAGHIHFEADFHEITSRIEVK